MSTFDRLDVLAMVSTVMYSREKESGSWTPTTETTDQESLSMMESSELEEYEYTTPIPTKTLQGDDQQYWMDPQWVPTNANGKQKTPNSIRLDLAAFMDANKFSRSKVISALGVNPNSFRKFMQHKYADQWRATENGTYWAAARLLEAEFHEPQLSMSPNKYKVVPTVSVTKRQTPKPLTIQVTQSADAPKQKGIALMLDILNTPGDNAKVKYGGKDVAAKVRTFLRKHPGITKSAFCKIALQNADQKRFQSFLATPRSGSPIFQSAKAFFAKEKIYRSIHGDNY